MRARLSPVLVDALRAALGRRARPEEPLARHTSFRIGGPAELLVVPDNEAELATVLATAAAHATRVTMLGGGSNVLVGDGGIPGLVVKLGRGFGQVEWTTTDGGASVRAGASVQLGRLARDGVARGFAGLEFAEGIPGTVGGALFMNAGAYGGDLSTVVEAVGGIDPARGPCTFGGDALTFRYRRTELPPGFVVTAVRFRLATADAGAVADRMESVRVRRVASQPKGQASAGSIFKNPPGDFAGRLIEAVGLKGIRAGRARISPRHANVIVNEGGACANDVRALIETAQRVVWERKGVWLEPEVRLVGSW